MSSTGTIQTWSVNPLDVGPIYPFVGWEMSMFAASVAFCIAFFVWKFTTESAHYAKRAQKLSEPDALATALMATSLHDNESHSQ